MLQAILGGVQLAAKAYDQYGSELTPAAIAQRKLLKEDVAKMKNGQLGYSDAQKAQMTGRAEAAMQAQTDAQRGELLRQQQASGAGAGGAAFQAGQNLAVAQQAGLANQTAALDQQSAQLAQQQRQDILARLAAQNARNDAMHQWRVDKEGGMSGLASSAIGLAAGGGKGGGGAGTAAAAMQGGIPGASGATGFTPH